MTKIGLYGSGWRAEYFLRVARALPCQFEIVGVITTNEEKAAWFTQEFGVKCHKTLNEFSAAEAPDYMVVSVNASASTDITLRVLESGIPVLLETPAAPDLETLYRFNQSFHQKTKIQIAEQYPLQPMHKARLAFLRKGKIGTPSHVQISYTHAFHGMSIIRDYLNIGFENAEITAKKFTVPIVAGYTRTGEPAEEIIKEHTQTVAVFDFGRKTALFNHETDQHRSWVRSPIIQIKGERGEIFNNKIKYLADFKTPIESEFIRKDLGREENFEGFDLKGIFADGEWLYRNPYQGSRLADDEIAVAECMASMAEYVKGNTSRYGLPEASQDVYLSLMMDEAAKSGRPVRTETQLWAL